MSRKRCFSPLTGFALILPVLLVLAGAAAAQETHPLSVEGVPSNLGLAHSLCERVAAQTLAVLGPHAAQRCLSSKPLAEHSGNGLLEVALAQAGRDAGLRVAPSPEDCELSLEYRILELRIAYTNVDRSALGFKKEIERHGTCVLASSLVDTGSGEELASTQQEVLLADRFPYELEGLLRSDSYAFTAPELKEHDWTKTAEPIVVTALISGLVYLFFSNQSSD